ncbi:YncE family protein [Alloacidobacterium dinghuense]|uniref:YncE family protein n=1 Tax=Alloacidobacterium dinghuense TaxID=2763107 RepID=A0A7G8BFQ3_9BACT|nr:YncE family protein [Alloacidobacterium dinghuense]QNI31373.1 YncE family protein [Alloacidobacterium dinghuense]
MRIFYSMIAGILTLTLHGQTIAVVQEGPGKVLVFPAADPSHPTAIAVGEKPHEIELTPDGRTAYVSNFGLLEANHKAGTPGTTISVLDLERRVVRARFKLPAGFTAPHGLKLRPPKFQELFTNAEEGNAGMVVFDAASGAVLRTFPLPPGVHNFIFNADGSALFAFTTEGKVCRIDPEAGKMKVCIATGSPRGLAWTADGHHLIVSGKSELLMLEPDRLTGVTKFGHLDVGQIFYPSVTPDGRWILAPAVLDGVVLVIDAKTGAVAHRIETGSPLLAALDADGKHAWVSNVRIPAGLFNPETKARDGGLVKIDLSTFQTTAIPGIVDTNGLAIAASR